MYSQLIEELSKAIGARLLIQFEYNNDTFIVEPHLIGMNQNKQDCLFAWHTSVSSGQKEQEGWRCFLLTDIKSMLVMDDMFSKQRPGYDPYNNMMSRVYYRI